MNPELGISTLQCPKYLDLEQSSALKSIDYIWIIICLYASLHLYSLEPATRGIILNTKSDKKEVICLALLGGAVEYTDCFSAER